MSAYVPIPKGQNGVNTNLNVVGALVTYLYPGVVRSSVKTLPTRGVYGAVTRSKGKPISVKGKKWSPCRPYSRGAYQFLGASGQIRATHPYGSLTEWKVASGVRLTGSLSTLDTFATAPFATSSFRPTPIDSNTLNRLVTECLQKVGDRRISLGEAIGESRQSISMISRNAITLARALLAARKFRFGEVGKILGIKRRFRGGKTLSERWLEYQYGWLPLMSDIYDGYGVFRDGLSRPQLIRAVRRLSSTGDVTANSRNNVFATGTAKRDDQCTLFYRVDDAFLASFNQLGLINPLEVAWALVPFSFVVDWFLPVQNVLEASTATSGLTFVDGCLSSRYVHDIELNDRAVEGGWTLDENATDLKFVVSASGFSRSVISNPSPALYIKSPFSSIHAINALALLHQLRR